MTFYPSAAAAVAAGYRACRRCRPDASPGSPEWDLRGDVVARVMRLIRDGMVDRAGVPGLAAAVGYSVRQLERRLRTELGAGPAALARAHRAHSARLLIESTAMPLSEVAFAAGFSSIRAFNAAVAEVYAATPTDLRLRVRGSRAPAHPAPAAVRLRLPRRDPFVPDSLFAHLAATAAPGIEEWREGAYRTVLRLPHAYGIAALRPETTHVAATLWLADPRDLTPAIARCRGLLDLDADPEAVGAVLGADPDLGGLWQQAPGRRVPRSLDAADFALRAVIAQQVSVTAAATIAGRMAATVGDPIPDPDGGLLRAFPSPAAVAAVDPASLPMPGSRARTLVNLATALAEGSADLTVGCDRAEARRQLAAIPGIGPWTVEIVALRGLGDPDAFPAGDLGVRHGLARLGLSPSAATRWAPWRAYATQYLWASDPDHPINHWEAR